MSTPSQAQIDQISALCAMSGYPHHRLGPLDTTERATDVIVALRARIAGLKPVADNGGLDDIPWLDEPTPAVSVATRLGVDLAKPAGRSRRIRVPDGLRAGNTGGVKRFPADVAAMVDMSIFTQQQRLTDPEFVFTGTLESWRECVRRLTAAEASA